MVEGSGVRFPKGVRDVSFKKLKTGSGAHPAFYLLDIGVGKRRGVVPVLLQMSSWHEQNMALLKRTLDINVVFLYL